MSIVGKPFSHDLFISYSHGAARTAGRSRLASWSERLADELVVELLDVEPDFDALDLFIDRRLDPTLNLTPQLQEKVENSALLLVVMSPRYLASSWCKDELAWFEQEVNRRQQSQGCVLVVRALPTKPEQWPACLKDKRGHTVLGFSFHPEPVDEETRPYGWASTVEDDPEFIKALSSLAGVVQKRLRQLREHRRLREAEQAGLEVRIVGSPVLYLHARPEDAAAWQDARGALQAEGFTVRPDELPRGNGAIDAMLAASMQRVRDCIEAHALLILRPAGGEWIDDHLKATGRLEREQIEALRKRPLPCAVLDQHGGELPVAGELDIERLEVDGENWLLELKAWLAKALGQSPESDP